MNINLFENISGLGLQDGIWETCDEMKDEMIKIIDGGEFKDNNSPLLYSLNHVVELLDYEKELINNL